jgi:hypothetical protein
MNTAATNFIAICVRPRKKAKKTSSFKKFQPPSLLPSSSLGQPDVTVYLGQAEYLQSPTHPPSPR